MTRPGMALATHDDEAWYGPRRARWRGLASRPTTPHHPSARHHKALHEFGHVGLHIAGPPYSQSLCQCGAAGALPPCAMLSASQAAKACCMVTPPTATELKRLPPASTCVWQLSRKPPLPGALLLAAEMFRMLLATARPYGTTLPATCAAEHAEMLSEHAAQPGAALQL